VIEGGWLLALLFAPYYFSLLSARHFEPDKATAVRALALVMLAAWAIKTIEHITMLGERVNWRAWTRAPLAVPVLAYAGVFLLTTAFSVSPDISWWGSYNRLQGTYTNLSYIAIFAAVVGNLRRREQIDRLVTTTILTGFSVAMYGLVQHNGLDPLPWKGDVLTRISSTMGNSIFVAAYLIMVVPFVLMRIVTSVASARQATGGNAGRDAMWGGSFALLLVSQQALLLGLLKFGAAIRVTDFRYWWVFPLGLAVVLLTFVMTSRRQTYMPSRTLTVFAGATFAFWALLFGLVYAASQGVQQADSRPVVADWGLWTGLGGLGMFAVIVLNFFLPPRPDEESAPFAWFETAGYLVALVVILLAIFYSQSRGPQIGLLVGLAVFINVLLLRLLWNARATGSGHVGLLRGLIAAAVAVELAATAFLLAFNLSQAPFFERLREVPYVGRFGQFLETSDGTGRVRTLIWAGDGVGTGAIGLITSNPLRTIVGYGPETMFTAFNPFYPPELARYEARGASPDRSHQALLDELVTKGVLGLLSYVFLFFSAFWLAWRLLRRSSDLAFQVLFIACLSALVAHLFEGLTGIPIVSTLTMLWTVLGVMVAGGVLDGQLSLGGAAVAPVAAPVEEEVPPTLEPRKKGKGRNAQANRAAARGGTVARTPTPHASGSYRWTYALVAAMVLAAVWFWNIEVAYADMWYNQASSFQPQNENEEIYKLSRLLNAIENAPDEDYYYLQLGNSLIQLGYSYKARNPQSQADVAPLEGPLSLATLFEGGSSGERALALWQNTSAEEFLEYARLVLERAYALNPGNKDHPANLGRLHALWYGLRQDPAHLQAALRWYEQAHAIAPNDVVILNEWATTLASRGEEAYGEVEAKLRESQRLDPRFADTYVKLGNLYRIQNRLPEATDQYVQAIERRANALEDDRERSLEPAIAALRSDPALLRQLMGAYKAAVERRPDDAAAHAALGRVAAAMGDPATVRAAFDKAISSVPDSVAYRQQYTLALSATEEYDLALQQAQAGLELARTQQREADITTLTRLIETLQQRTGSGGT
jgi:tetratricopeptide (TPR) repeat protein/O-antigen ligase